MNPVLKDYLPLIEEMMNAMRHQEHIYQPGEYWIRKAQVSYREILRKGISDFRGSSSLIGDSYSDNSELDVRLRYVHGLRFMLGFASKLFPLSKVFDAQVGLTRSYMTQANLAMEHALLNSPRIAELLQRYQVPYSLLGGCVKSVKVGNSTHALSYLNMLDQHSRMAEAIDFSGVKVVAEIGGGFGANIHILLANYPSIRKVLYLDIPPNLYIGTQYLRAFYPDAIRDFLQLKDEKKIQFSSDDTLEIFCIPPWLIENISIKIDIFMNAHSFVEMPQEVVANYGQKILQNAGDKLAVSLITYDQHDPKTTFDPKMLPSFFPNLTASSFTAKSLVDPRRENLYFKLD